MNDIDLLRELAQDTPLPGPAELGPARARLAAAIAAAPGAGLRTGPAAPGRRPYPWLLATAAAAAAASAVIAALVVTPAGRPAGGLPAHPPGGTGHADITAAQVLRHAALAALQLRAGAPLPGQFVYTKIENGDGSVYQSWLSADGTRTGLIRGAGGGPAAVAVPGCRDGRQLRVRAPRAEGGTPGGQPCVPQPAYDPGLPASPGGLRAYFGRTLAAGPASPAYRNDLGKAITGLLTQGYLTSGQRAALYDLMAQTPGFTLVPRAGDGIGRRGAGIAWSLPAGGGKDMIIFDPRTYAELGFTTWGADGQQAATALLDVTLVNRAGQLP